MADLPAFLLTALLLELTPGPNMTWLAILAASRGVRAGLAATAGIALGLVLLGLGSAIGIAGLVAAWPAVRAILAWVGAVYIPYLAWDTLRPERQKDAPAENRAFGRGLLVNTFNIKTLSTFAVLFPRHTTPDAGVPEFLLLAGLYTLVATAVHLVIVGFAAPLNRMLVSPRREQTIRTGFALALTAVAAWFVVSNLP